MIWSSRLMSQEFFLNTAWYPFAFPKLRTRGIVGVLLCCCGMLQGCVVLPVPRSAEQAAGSRADIPTALKEQIIPGKSRRVDVLLVLGEPDVRVNADSSFIYYSRTARGGIGWVMLWGVPAYAASQGGAVKLGNWKDVLHRAIIRFDDAGVVTGVNWEDCKFGPVS